MTDALKPRARRTRAAILAAAQAVFLAKGYLPAGMDEIAAAAGVSKQTVYAHFQGKEALFVAMARAMIDAAIAARDAHAPAPAVDADIPAFLRAYGRAQMKTAASPGLMQLRRLAIAEAQRFPQFGSEVFAAGPGAAIARLTGIFAAWHDAGRLRTPEPARAAATFNWLLMGGPTSEAMLLGRPRATDAAATQAHVNEAVRVFLAAYGPASGPDGDHSHSSAPFFHS